MSPSLKQVHTFVEAVIGYDVTGQQERLSPRERYERMLRATCALFGRSATPEDDAVVLRHERLPEAQVEGTLATLREALAEPPERAIAVDALRTLRTTLTRLRSKASPGTLRPRQPDEASFPPNAVINDDGEYPLLLAHMSEHLRYDDDLAYLCAAWNAVTPLLMALSDGEEREARLTTENAQLRAEREALAKRVHALGNPPFATRTIG